MRTTFVRNVLSVRIPGCSAPSADAGVRRMMMRLKSSLLLPLVLVGAAVTSNAQSNGKPTSADMQKPATMAALNPAAAPAKSLAPAKAEPSTVRKVSVVHAADGTQIEIAGSGNLSGSVIK